MKKLLFELSAADAATVVSWIPEIIEKGISAKDCAAFKRLEKALLKPKPSHPLPHADQ